MTTRLAFAPCSGEDRIDKAEHRVYILCTMTQPAVAPRLATLTLLLLGLVCASPAADNWIEVRSPHFTVATNAGEKEGRRIADQFELIRATFHSAFPGLRVDIAQAVVVIAAKNEATMKQLVPEEWEDKKRAHHA